MPALHLSGEGCSWGRKGGCKEGEGGGREDGERGNVRSTGSNQEKEAQEIQILMTPFFDDVTMIV